MDTAVTEYGAGTELVTDWESGALYIDTPVDEDDEVGLVSALDEAMRRGLTVIEPEEMGEFEEIVDGMMRLWLVPEQSVEGWL